MADVVDVMPTFSEPHQRFPLSLLLAMPPMAHQITLFNDFGHINIESDPPPIIYIDLIVPILASPLFYPTFSLQPHSLLNSVDANVYLLRLMMSSSLELHDTDSFASHKPTKL